MTMKDTQRPLSPFMIGPYYKPQMTSLMSISHRATGVFLSVVGAPLMLWWIIATASGPAAWDRFAGFGEALAHDLAGKVDVGAFFEIDAHDRESEVGDRTDFLDLGQAAHGSFDREGDGRASGGDHTEHRVLDR